MSKKSFPTNSPASQNLALERSKLAQAEALVSARTNTEPWFRSQALAAVARYSPDDQVETMAKKALDTASGQFDPYNVVAVSAWAVRALIEREKYEKAEQSVCRLLALSGRIDHPVSRLEALFMLWQAVYPLGGDTRRRVQDKFVAACRVANSWKAGDRLAWAATILASDDLDEAMRLIGLLREGRHKRQALRRIESGNVTPVRDFFH